MISFRSPRAVKFHRSASDPSTRQHDSSQADQQPAGKHQNEINRRMVPERDNVSPTGLPADPMSAKADGKLRPTDLQDHQTSQSISAASFTSSCRGLIMPTRRGRSRSSCSGGRDRCFMVQTEIAGFRPE